MLKERTLSLFSRIRICLLFALLFLGGIFFLPNFLFSDAIVAAVAFLLVIKYVDYISIGVIFIIVGITTIAVPLAVIFSIANDGHLSFTSYVGNIKSISQLTAPLLGLVVLSVLRYRWLDFAKYN